MLAHKGLLRVGDSPAPLGEEGHALQGFRSHPLPKSPLRFPVEASKYISCQGACPLGFPEICVLPKQWMRKHGSPCCGIWRQEREAATKVPVAPRQPVPGEAARLGPARRLTHLWDLEESEEQSGACLRRSAGQCQAWLSARAPAPELPSCCRLGLGDPCRRPWVELWAVCTLGLCTSLAPTSRQVTPPVEASL